MLRDISHTVDPTVTRVTVGIGIFRQVAKPLLNNACYEPIINIGLEARIAHRKILCAMIQPATRHTTCSHAPTWTATFVEYAHGLVYLA